MSTEKNRAIIASLIKMGEHAPHLQPHLRPVLDRLTREAVRVTEDPATAFGELRGILQSSDNLLKQLSTYIVMKGSKDPARFVDEVLPYIEGALRGRTGELERTACRYVMQNGVLTRTDLIAGLSGDLSYGAVESYLFSITGGEIHGESSWSQLAPVFTAYGSYPISIHVPHLSMMLGRAEKVNLPSVRITADVVQIMDPHNRLAYERHGLMLVRKALIELAKLDRVGQLSLLFVAKPEFPQQVSRLGLMRSLARFVKKVPTSTVHFNPGRVRDPELDEGLEQAERALRKG